MSSDADLERLLREAQKTLPGPDDASTRRARARARVPRRRSRRVRVAALLGVAIAVAIGLGVGIGSLIAPSGTAAASPVGFGFLPEPGWQALQAAAPRAPGQPQVAMAANVPFAADDVVHGLAEPSALPYSTLLDLPSDGVVIVVSLASPDPFQPPQPATRYPRRELPLRVRDATPYIEFGTQLRPEQPLGQRQLRVQLDGRYLDAHLYFGTPDPGPDLLASAQGQLERLVVGRTRDGEPARTVRQARPVAPAAPGVIDRTFACSPAVVGGVHQIEAVARVGSGRQGSTWDRPAFATIGTSAVGAAARAVENQVAWITAGRPSTTANVSPGFGSFQFPFRTWGTIAVNRTLCRAAKARVPLARADLKDLAPGVFENPFDCVTPRRVLLRIRAAVEVKRDLKSFRGFLMTTSPVETATLAVRSPSGKPIVYAQVLESGKTELHTAKGCVED